MVNWSLNLREGCMDVNGTVLATFSLGCNPSKYKLEGGGNERFALFSFLFLKHFFYGRLVICVFPPSSRGLPGLLWLLVNTICVHKRQNCSLPSLLTP